MEKDLSKQFFDAFKRIGLISEGLKITPSEWEHGVYVDTGSKSFEEYTIKNDCDIQKASTIEYSKADNVISGEVLVPHCKTEKHGDFLTNLGVDLCEPCEIEAVHAHAGKCPTTHIHFNCDMDKIANKRHCIEKIAVWMSKLNDFSNETCK